MVPGGPTYQLPLTSGDRRDRQRGPRLRHQPDPVHAGDGELLQHHVRRTRGRGRRREDAGEAEGFGFNSTTSTTWHRQAESNFPEEMDAAETGQSGIGQFEVAATPLQMAMVAAGIANGGTVMKPYLVDEIRSPELDVLRQGRPGGVLAGRVGDDGGRGDRADDLHGRPRAPRARRPSRASRSPARPAPPRAASTTSRRTPGSCPSRRRRPAGRGRDHDPEGRHPPRRDRRRRRSAGPIAKSVMEAVIR